MGFEVKSFRLCRAKARKFKDSILAHLFKALPQISPTPKDVCREQITLLYVMRPNTAYFCTQNTFTIACKILCIADALNYITQLFDLTQYSDLQAGDRQKAMKALMQTHDIDKIVLFANVSRNRDIYLVAAQYLQTSRSWLQDEGTMKTIAAFYTKAKSPEHLAGFYEACAQAEIDECRDYKRAITAMQVLPSGSFLDEISDRSPRKIIHFHYLKKRFGMK